MISVIIPCYNSEKTIIGTLKSLERQIYRTFEVIIIDDGSTDNSKNCIEQYIEQSSLNIKLLLQDNRGVSYSRNRGMRESKSEYITFLDADDLYDEYYLYNLYKAISFYNADFALCKYKVTANDDRNIIKGESILVDKYEALELFMHKRKYKINFWCGIYKREIIENSSVFFSEDLYYGEDSEFFCKYIYHCDKGGVYLDCAMYNYLIQKTSATKSTTYRKTDNITAFQNIVNYWEKDSGFERINGKYLIDRAIWATAKELALGKKELYQKFVQEYDVVSAMKNMVQTGDEISIRISALFFLINKYLFFFIIKVYSFVVK